MSIPNFPSTGLVPNVTTFQVGDILYMWDGEKWKSITAPLKADQITWKDGKTAGYALDDFQGVKDELYSQAGIVDNGLPNELGNSQFVESIKVLEKSAVKVVTSSGGNIQQFVDTLCPDSSNKDLFLIYGQSNARGSANNTVGRLEITPTATYWSRTAQDWLQMTHTMESAWASDGLSSTGHAWSSFANRYNQQTNRDTLWIPGAIGGKNITELSKGIGDGIYEALLVEFNTAIAELSLQGITPSSINLVFHQGESDQSDGTTWDDYFDLLEQMLADFRSDFGVQNFFFATVGNPTSTGRNELNWHVIRSVQEYVADRNEDVTIAFDEFKHFNQQNGLLRSDGTHATQNGYNIMGQSMADYIVKTGLIDNLAGGTTEYLNAYNTETQSVNRAKDINAVVRLYNSGSGTVAEIKTRLNGTTYISSYVTGVSLTATEIVLECEGLRNHYLYDIQVSATDSNNPTEHISANAKSAVVGNNKVGIKVRLNKDLTFSALTNNGSESLYATTDLTKPITIFDIDSLNLVVNPSYISLIHNTSNVPRIATMATATGSPSVTGGGLVIAQPSGIETRIPKGIGWVNIFIPSFTIRPNSVISGTEIFIHIRAKAENKAA